MTTDLLEINTQKTENPIYLYNDNGDRYDVSDQEQFPLRDIPDSLDNYKPFVNAFSETKDYYYWNGIKVPRVTHILDYCKGDIQPLLKWAANLGRRYHVENKVTVEAGTKIHEAIAEYLTSGTTYCLADLYDREKAIVMKSVQNFMAWYNHVTLDLGWKVEIYISEAPLICPWCGGTTDAILIINGKRYIVDFKSSKRIQNEYFIQVSAYLWIVENFYPQYGPIDGVGILRFDKFKDEYQGIFLEKSDPEDSQFIFHCQQAFGVALTQYYCMNALFWESKDVFARKQEDIIKGSISQDHKKAPVRNQRKSLKKWKEGKYDQGDL